MDDRGFPPQTVLRAFGATEPPVRMAGGQGQNYRSGQIVLKPAKDDEETTWTAEFYLAVNDPAFRLPKPLRSDRGGFVCDGWQAWEYIEGEHRHEEGCWQEIIGVCVRFHQAIADMPRPAWFARREQNPWVVADKVAWGEAELAFSPPIAPAVERLRRRLRRYPRPVGARSQIIHGDFGGNVLFADGVPPAVIDLSPYWRPAAFAVGVIIADAIVWEGAEMALIAAGNGFADFTQHLLRAELRRIIELETLHQIYGWEHRDDITAHLPLIEVLENL
ncbi:MAG: aminoglycoside phosphotransferase [Anaerolineae bacterium]|nr:aminoglycoside phosphotransferase [Anaerolineae bacterium]